MTISKEYLSRLLNKNIIEDAFLKNGTFNYIDSNLENGEIIVEDLFNISKFYLSVYSYNIDEFNNKFYLIKNNKILDSKEIINSDLDFIKFCDDVFNKFYSAF